MDCEKFDRVVLDLLYEELDELTSAAARRHMEQCTRCRNIGSRLRATREVGVLPMIEAPAGLEARILQAEREANAVLPLRKRLGRAVSIMASYAMRPQLAMAALLLLMIGSSLLFLRARPGQRESVQVTERGVPEREGQSVAIVPMPAASAADDVPSHGAPDRARRKHHAPRHSERAESAPRPAAAPMAAADQAARGDKNQAGLENTTGAAGDAGDGQSAYDRAMAAYRAGRYAEAQRRFEDVAQTGGEKAPTAALYAALAQRSSSGCRTAAARFDSVSSRYSGTGVGNEASWQAADCYRSIGDNERARRHYTALLSVSGYSDRARAALDSLGSGSGGGTAVASRHTAAAKAAAPPPAKAKKAAPPPMNADEPTK